MKIRGAKICHAYVLHLSSWKDLLNDERYGDYKNPILQYMYMYVHVIWGFTKTSGFALGFL